MLKKSLFVADTVEKLFKNSSSFNEDCPIMLRRSVSAWIFGCVSASSTNKTSLHTGFNMGIWHFGEVSRTCSASLFVTSGMIDHLTFYVPFGLAAFCIAQKHPMAWCKHRGEKIPILFKLNKSYKETKFATRWRKHSEQNPKKWALTAVRSKRLYIHFPSSLYVKCGHMCMWVYVFFSLQENNVFLKCCFIPSRHSIQFPLSFLPLPRLFTIKGKTPFNKPRFIFETHKL